MYLKVPEEFRPEEWSGLFVLGGPMNVDETDRYPYLGVEIDWIRSALDADLPILGICLGSQLLAKTLGARVTAGETKEIGFYDLKLTADAGNDPLLAGLPPTVRSFQWHGDTFELPKGAVRLASSEAFANQAFRFGRYAYGLQFHWEVTAEMIRAWLDVPGNQQEIAALPEIDPAAIRSAIAAELPAIHLSGNTVFERFADLCAD